MKPEVEMRNWDFCILSRFTGFGKSSEPTFKEERCLAGNIGTGHPHIEAVDGHRVLTSEIVSLDLDKRIVETRNTIYKLVGNPKYGLADEMAKDRGIAIKSTRMDSLSV